MQEIQEIWVWSLGQEDPLEEGMATHSRILAWEITWTEQSGGWQTVTMGSQGVGHDWATKQWQHVLQESSYPKHKGTLSAHLKVQPWNPSVHKGAAFLLREKHVSFFLMVGTVQPVPRHQKWDTRYIPPGRFKPRLQATSLQKAARWLPCTGGRPGSFQCWGG